MHKSFSNTIKGILLFLGLLFAYFTVFSPYTDRETEFITLFIVIVFVSILMREVIKEIKTITDQFE